MGSGYWIAECVQFASGKMVHGYPGGRHDIGKHPTDRELLESNDWLDLPAVKAGRVAVADGNKYYNRSSVASILGTAEMVAEFAHPELRGAYGHHGTRC